MKKATEPKNEFFGPDYCRSCGKLREKGFYHEVNPAVHAERDYTSVWICWRCKNWVFAENRDDYK